MNEFPFVKCKNCIYSKKVETQVDTYECHAGPPSVIAIPSPVPPSPRNPGGGVAVNVSGYFPPVQSDSWCGEGYDGTTGEKLD